MVWFLPVKCAIIQCVLRGKHFRHQVDSEMSDIAVDEENFLEFKFCLDAADLALVVIEHMICFSKYSFRSCIM